MEGRPERVRGLVRPGSRRRDAGVRQSGVATPTVASVRQFHVAWWLHPASFTRRRCPVFFASSSRSSRVVPRVGVSQVPYGREQQAAAFLAECRPGQAGRAAGGQPAYTHTHTSQPPPPLLLLLLLQPLTRQIFQPSSNGVTGNRRHPTHIF